MNENEHPIVSLLKHYVRSFSSIKQNYEDLDNVTFNRNYGLEINIPQCWPNAEAVVELIKWAAAQPMGFKEFLVIYPSTAIYDKVSKNLNLDLQQVSYFSWHELAVAMNRVQNDMQHIKNLRAKIESADLVVFLGTSSALPDVIDQVRGFCTSCLIMVG
jgi:hypothetical protein